jgi:hypothetical protein
VREVADSIGAFRDSLVAGFSGDRYVLEESLNDGVFMITNALDSR